MNHDSELAMRTLYYAALCVVLSAEFTTLAARPTVAAEALAELACFIAKIQEAEHERK